MIYFPTEILENIFGYCDACDTGNIAQTCKDLNSIVYGRMWRGVFPKMIKEESRFPANFPVKQLLPPNAKRSRTLSATLINPQNIISLQHELSFSESGPIHRTKMVQFDTTELTAQVSAELEGTFNICEKAGNRLFLATKNALYTLNLREKSPLKLIWETTEHESGHITTVIAKEDTVAWTMQIPFSHTEIRIANLSADTHLTVRWNTGFEVKQVLIDSSEKVYAHIIAPGESSIYAISKNGNLTQGLLSGTYNKLFLDHNDKLELLHRGERSQQLLFVNYSKTGAGFVIDGMWSAEEPKDMTPITKDRVALLSLNTNNHTLLLRIIDTFEKQVIWLKKLDQGKKFSSLKLHATAGKVLGIADSQLYVYDFC